MEYYKALDIQRQYNVPRSTVYVKFKQDNLQQYMSEDSNGTKVISRQGLDILLRELEDSSRTVQESVQEDEHKQTTEVQLEVQLLQQIIADKNAEIEYLRSALDVALELNKNNQVLLLERKEEKEAKEQAPVQKQSLLGRLFGK